jgi:hypothetical protein
MYPWQNTFTTLARLTPQSAYAAENVKKQLNTTSSTALPIAQQDGHCTYLGVTPGIGQSYYQNPNSWAPFSILLHKQDDSAPFLEISEHQLILHLTI